MISLPPSALSRTLEAVAFSFTFLALTSDSVFSLAISPPSSNITSNKSNRTSNESSSSPSSNRTSNELAFLLFPDHDSFQEGDVIESIPSGFFLDQLHGQLVLYQGDPSSGESILLWKSGRGYVSDGSGFSSVAIFQDDCNLALYSEPHWWPLWISHSACSDSPCSCFLAWSIRHERLSIYAGTIDDPGEEVKALGWRPQKITNKTSRHLNYLIQGVGVPIIPGFMIESQPPGLFLWFSRGELYLYRGMPSESNSELLWKTEHAFVYNGDSENMTGAILQGDGNLVIYAKGSPPLWASGSSDECHGHCILAWQPSEERLITFDAGGQEIWTSRDFRWIPNHWYPSVTGQIIIMTLTRFSGTLSLIGSGLIIVILISRWTKNWKSCCTRDRLLFGMSIHSIIEQFSTT